VLVVAAVAQFLYKFTPDVSQPLLLLLLLGLLMLLLFLLFAASLATVGWRIRFLATSINSSVFQLLPLLPPSLLLLMLLLFTASLATVGWRIPFLASSVTLVAAIIVRFNMPE
jgi:hypothetical protein